MRDRLYVHIVWITRDRQPTIEARAATFLARYLPAVARQERARLHALGIVRTHVHVLLQLHPTTSISKLMQRLKGGSSVLANREGHTGARPLRWARGYDIESVSPRAFQTVRAYVLGQAQHHPDEAIPGWNGASMNSADGPDSGGSPERGHSNFATESRDSAHLSPEATRTERRGMSHSE